MPRAWLWALCITAWGVAGVDAQSTGSQTYRCVLAPVTSGGMEGPCEGLEMSGVRKTAAVLIDSGPDRPGPWSGDLIVDRGRLRFELAEEPFGDSTRLVMRENEINWFLAYTWVRQVDGPVVLVFNVLDIALPSRQDVRIIEDVLARLDALDTWDREDDRDCLNDGAGSASLFCLFFSSVRQEMGRYHHRQPGAELVRSMIRELWPGRIGSHALMDFNNHPETTLAEIRRILREAIQRIESIWELEHWAEPFRGI